MITDPVQPETTTPAATKTGPFAGRARFTLVARYKAAVLKANPGRSTQTFRGDYTRQQFYDRSVTGFKDAQGNFIEIKDMHDMAVLIKKWHETKYLFDSAILYDNYQRKPLIKSQSNPQIVVKFIWDDENKIFQHTPDLRDEYYDRKTGKPHDFPINKIENQNPWRKLT